MRLSRLVASLLVVVPSVAQAGVGLLLAGPSQGAQRDLVVSHEVHTLDVRPEGLEYFLAVRIRDPSFAATAFNVGLVVPLPRRPEQVGVVAAGLFVGLDAATSGQVLPCPANAPGGCSSTANTAVPPPSPVPLGLARSDDARNMPLLAHALPGTADEAIAFFRREKLSVTPELQGALDALYKAGSVALVLHYAEDARDGQLRQGPLRGATVRATFTGMTLPFSLPLSFRAGPQGATEVETSLIVLADGKQASLEGVEVLPIDVKTVPSPQPVRNNGRGGGTVEVDKASCCGDSARAIDTAVRQTLGSKAGRAFILETAQYLREANVAAGLPFCTFGEDQDQEGCQPQQQTCKGCEPLPPPLDAGVAGKDAGTAGDGGSSDGGVSDAGTPLAEKERTSSTLPRMFPRDRFVTRFTSLALPSAMQGTLAIGLGETAAAVGPGYLNCPAQAETGCASATGPAELGFALFALALLRRRPAR